MRAPGDSIELETNGMAFGGRAVGRDDGFVFFVEGALPGERVRARVEQIHRHHGFARTLEVMTASPARVAPGCPVFGRCGGCAWLHWDYAAQCRAKTDFVREALRRFPETATALPDLSADGRPFQFRNHMAYSITRDPEAAPVVGLHEQASRDRIVSAATCRLPLPAIAELRTRLADALPNLPELPRRAVIRASEQTGERLLHLLADRELPGIDGLARALDDACEHLVLSIGPDGPPHRALRKTHRIKGKGILIERLGGYDFEIGPETFFQTNTPAAEAMLAYLRARVDRLAPARLVDLYAGVGALSLGLAAPDRQVAGFEAAMPAVRAARNNAIRNGLDGVVFRRVPVEGVRPMRRGPPDVAVVDPPRAGLTPAARRAVLALGTPVIFYVSCNPSTLARDLDALAAGGYRVGAAQAFDLFPQTTHVECVVELTREMRDGAGICTSSRALSRALS